MTSDAIHRHQIDLWLASKVVVVGRCASVQVTSSCIARRGRDFNAGDHGSTAMRAAQARLFGNAGIPSFIRQPMIRVGRKVPT